MTHHCLRILLFNTAHRWIGEAAGTDLLARALHLRGHDVRVVVPRGGKLHRSLERTAQYRLLPIDWRLPKGRGSGHLRQFRHVARLLSAIKPDVVHVGRGQEHWCVALLRLFCSPRSCIVRTRHVTLPLRQNLTNRWLFRKGVEAVTAVSQAAFRGLGGLARHLPHDRSRVVEGAVDLACYSPRRRTRFWREELGAGQEDTVLVGCLGRWQRIKGHDIFLDAMARVARRHPGVRVVVAGRKVTLNHPKLRRYHDASGLGDRAVYLGSVEDPAGLIASLDIGVVASRGSEGFSRIAVEYFASGVPVVATRVGALPELIKDGVNGLLVPPEDPAAMAAAIGRLAASPARRAKTALNAARELVPRFSPQRLAEEMEAVYHAAIRARRARS
ncbi:glycosyltransferase family 4 protein [Candidatus Poribacteria bacterium]|nr:glycosyltransferase family 4 protein [Candidatus Poribacteria bacterium]